MAFVNHLKLEPLPGTNYRVLLDALVYRLPGTDSYISVPTGFKTNYASVPRFLWRMYRPDAGDTRRASTLHDFLYEEHHGLTRKKVDLIFRGALKEEGASWFKRQSMYWGVRAGGGSHWI